ncbi:MAG: hypothetical protein ACRYG2_05860 [Janthinobacterium lividum]
MRSPPSRSTPPATSCRRPRLCTTDSRLSDRLDLVELDEDLAAQAAALLSTCIEQIVDVDGMTVEPAR